jgi:hypothetical protein
MELATNRLQAPSPQALKQTIHQPAAAVKINFGGKWDVLTS